MRVRGPLRDTDVQMSVLPVFTFTGPMTCGSTQRGSASAQAFYLLGCKMKTRFSPSSILASAVALLAIATVRAQPSLLPPGPPTAPSGRMGVRTEIRALPYMISAPGSYYLSASLMQTIAGSPGITINASRVTIDLMGFSLTGMGSPDPGITFGPGGPFRDVTIHDGFVSGWGGDGIGLSLVSDAHVWNVTSDGNAGKGILVGSVSIVRDVVSTNNGGDGIRTDFGCKITNAVTFYNQGTGINAGQDCHISDSTAVSNTDDGISLGSNGVLIGSTADGNGSDGVFASTSCRITDCSASYNGASGVLGAGSGFNASGDACSLNGCTAYQNLNSGFSSSGGGAVGSSVQDCVSANNGQSGFFTSAGFFGFKTVMNCRAKNNTGDGIVAINGAHVYRNTCEQNYQNGINVGGNLNIIEQNFVLLNTGNGIKSTNVPGGSGNMIASNRAAQNSGGNFSFFASDTTGPIIVGPVILSSPSAAMANISF